MMNAECGVAGSETGVDKWNHHATTAIGIEPSVGKGNVQDANLHAFVKPLFRNNVEQSKLNAAGQKLRIVNETELDAAQLPRIVDDAQLDAANRPFARIDEANLDAVQFSGLIEHARLKTNHATIDDVGEAEMDALHVRVPRIRKRERKTADVPIGVPEGWGVPDADGKRVEWPFARIAAASVVRRASRDRVRRILLTDNFARCRELGRRHRVRGGVLGPRRRGGKGKEGDEEGEGFDCGGGRGNAEC